MFIHFSGEDLKDIKELAKLFNITEEEIVILAVRHFVNE